MKDELQAALGAVTYRIEAPFAGITTQEGKVTDVAVDPADGTVFVLTRVDCRIDAPRDCVHVFSPAGEPLGSWGKTRILDAHKLLVDALGRVWVIDRDAHEVVAFDRSGRELLALGRRGAPLTPFNHPTDIAFFADGAMVVSDGYAAGRIHLFATDGTALGSFGGVGRKPGQFLVPHALGVLSDGRIVVADRENGRIQIFSRAGELLGLHDPFMRPQDVWIDADDTILVSDSIPTLTRITAEGEILGRCRATQNGPHGMCGAPGGVIYLAENNPSRVTRMVPVTA